MKMKHINAAIALAMFSSASCAAPGPTVLLATAAQVKAACQSLPQSGITCINDREAIDPHKLAEGSISMSAADYSLFDRTDRPAVKGFLILTRLTTAAGNDYYSAVPAVFKTGFAGVGMTSTELYYTQFWDAVKGRLSFNLPESDVTVNFLSQMDQDIAREREASEARLRTARETAAKAASDAAYRASPQYAADTAKRAVEACRNDIARARAALERDDRIAKISGYRNVSLREQAASIIVHCEDTIARSGH